MDHNTFDSHPVFRDQSPLFVNDPGVADITFSFREGFYSADETVPEDNVRIYVPIDLSREMILRRLNYVIARYGEATEANEFALNCDVRQMYVLI